jgi:hypothetical protein
MFGSASRFEMRSAKLAAFARSTSAQSTSASSVTERLL